MNFDFKKITEELMPIFEIAGNESIKLYNEGLKIEIKEDGSPVSNGDLIVNEIISQKISELTPEVPIISEETVNIKEKNKNSIFWLIDPIDGTKEYISGKDEYTLNAALVIDKKPIIGLVGVPKKKQLFYSYGIDKSFVKQNGKDEKINCIKKGSRKDIVAVSSSNEPSEIIMKKLKEYKITSVVKVASSYKFCLIADGTFDIYAAKERANEWDYAAGHAVAENAGAIITTLDNKPFLYGKEDYRNPSLLMLRSKNLND
tara:strand:- start:2021 stop:2797 length:777 start_codon:yes stop_codon:yes gene_type:complete